LERANELARATQQTVCCPLLELRRNRQLREAHLENLTRQAPKKRGEIDPHLAIARAKIEEAESVDEAATILRPRETFAVLNSAIVLGTLFALKQSQSAPSRPTDRVE
jgi:membrane glycosyltransferase